MAKRILSIALAALMILAAFAGCGDKDTTSSTPASSAPSNTESAPAAEDTGLRDLGDEDNITLKVWGPSTQQELLKAQCDEFVALYPDKKITIEVGICEESEARQNVLNDLEAAGDIFAFPSDHLEALQKAGALDFVQEVGAIEDANLPGAIEAATYNDILYAYPLTADNSYIMFYDNSIFSADDVKSLNTMVEKAKAANKKIYVKAGDGFFGCMFSFTGGLVIEHDYADGTEKQTYDEASVVATLKAFGELFKDGTLISADTKVGISGLTETGDAAAVIDGTWDATAIKDTLGDKMGAAKLPAINVGGTDKQIINLFGYKLMGVKYGCAFPKTAHALAEYLSGEKCQTEKAEKFSIGPSNKAAAESDAVKNNPVLLAVKEQMEFSLPQKSIANGFWNAHAALGDYLAKADSDLSDDALKAQFATCVEATKEV